MLGFIDIRVPLAQESRILYFTDQRITKQETHMQCKSNVGNYGSVTKYSYII